jgi:hypothetical protein
MLVAPRHQRSSGPAFPTRDLLRIYLRLCETRGFFSDQILGSALNIWVSSICPYSRTYGRRPSTRQTTNAYTSGNIPKEIHEVMLIFFLLGKNLGHFDLIFILVVHRRIILMQRDE